MEAATSDDGDAEADHRADDRASERRAIEALADEEEQKASHDRGTETGIRRRRRASEARENVGGVSADDAHSRQHDPHAADWLLRDLLSRRRVRRRSRFALFAEPRGAL